MNAFYVIVSIPLLLVLVGFNHAHGLTTFGKSQNQGTQQPQQGTAQGKSCTTQANCIYIKGTTCLKGLCYCGDNKNPINGKCQALHKGPRHICNDDKECVVNAECVMPKNSTVKQDGQTGGDKVCMCLEGMTEYGNSCGGGSNLQILPGLIIIGITIILKIIY